MIHYFFRKRIFFYFNIYKITLFYRKLKKKKVFNKFLFLSVLGTTKKWRKLNKTEER